MYSLMLAYRFQVSGLIYGFSSECRQARFTEICLLVARVWLRSRLTLASVGGEF